MPCFISGFPDGKNKKLKVVISNGNNTMMIV